MNRTMIMITAIATAMASAAYAQPGPGAGKGMGPGTNRWGQGVTPGWAMMTPEERDQHRAKMQAMTTYDECKTYQTQHHEAMAVRAKEKGMTMPAQPPRDPCAGLKK